MANPTNDSPIDSDLRLVLGTHGIIRLETLNTRLRDGLPISEVVQSELNDLIGEAPSKELVRHLSARLVDYDFPQNRRSLVALLAMSQARGSILTTWHLGK